MKLKGRGRGRERRRGRGEEGSRRGRGGGERMVSKERKGNIFSISALLSQIALHCMTSKLTTCRFVM